MAGFNASPDRGWDEGPVFGNALPQAFAWVVGERVSKAPVNDFLEAVLIDSECVERGEKGRRRGRMGERTEKGLMRRDICTLKDTCERALCCPISHLLLLLFHPSLPSLPPSLHVIFRLHDLVEVTKVRLHRLLSIVSVCNGTGFENGMMKGEQGT